MEASLVLKSIDIPHYYLDIVIFINSIEGI